MSKVQWFFAGGFLLLLLMLSGLPAWVWLVAFFIWIALPVMVMKQDEAEKRTEEAEERARRLR